MADIIFPGEVAGALNDESMPSNQDLVVYKGDYVDIYVTINDASNNPVDLTGWTPKAQFKQSFADYSPVNLTCSLTGTPGQVRIYLPSATSSTLAPGSYIWDFQLTSATGQTRTYLAGDVTVYNEVTT